jgi:hypothetical protein
MVLAPERWRPLMKLGDVGLDVRAWRVVLEHDGYALCGDARTFTTSVHNATVAWQRVRQLKVDGLVGSQTRSAISAFPAELVRRPFDSTAIPYLEAVNWSRHLGPQPKDLIVLHSIEAPEASTLAENTAAWFAGLRGPAPQTSAHYCVDDDSVLCCVPPACIAWHAPGANKNGIGIEHAGYARQSAAQWMDDFSVRMLRRSAELTAYLCDRFFIPVVALGPVELLRGERGITTHDAVSKAFKRSTHTDPGVGFPMKQYLQWVLDAS